MSMYVTQSVLPDPSCDIGIDARVAADHVSTLDIQFNQEGSFISFRVHLDELSISAIDGMVEDLEEAAETFRVWNIGRKAEANEDLETSHA